MSQLWGVIVMDSTTEQIRSALTCVPPCDRETWLRIGMAVKSELGEDGFDLFRVSGIVVHPFAPLDVNFAVIVNELSTPVQGSGSGRIGADGHHARILDRAMHLAFVIHEL